MSLRYRSVVLVILFGLITALTACSVLPESETLRIFLLPSSPTPQQASEPTVQQALRINTPQASRILSGQRIAVVPQGNQISAYGGARWADAAPVLLRDRLIEAFQRDGRMPSVSNEDVNLYADLSLHSDLRAFQTVYIDGKPDVVITLDARLVNRNDQRTLANRRFEVRQPSADPRVESVVEAFGQASDRLSADILEWTLSHARQLP
ncbi:ABC-type transport auxiliary lipoprotein family protein [Pseudomonas sp. KSR10]|jgi:cholesterol transport system auxiliary component|uniref:Lipoprotein n=1 Tax=Stutzerimonas stutzeri TaxID=316 RepID=A0A0D9AK13_STUST|nr:MULTISPECIES: ABC-type transport auxiliary lipoprotein family protein [Pseudomonadaceae]KJH79701.1 lipoprotein [Stutzerimonas stutzeri]MCG6541329.1 ABC-type transport auxiliary lipoprotein family protein [Pseudomonas sp. KSR10]